MENRLQGKFSTPKENHEFDIPVIIFEDHDQWFYYAPSFDLTGYGATKEEAEESLQVALTEFIRYTTTKKTTFKVLTELGWAFKKWNKKNKKLEAPSLATLLTRDKYLQEVFNEKVFHKTNKKINLPIEA